MASLNQDAEQTVHIVQSEITKQHSAILYILIALVVLVAGAMFYSNQHFQEQLQKTETAYTDLKDKEKTDAATLTQNVLDRENQAKQVDIQNQLTQLRDVQTATLQQKLRLPNTTSAQAETDLKAYTGHVAVHDAQGEEVDQETIQDFSATKVENISLKQDKADIEKSLATQTAMTASTQDDLTACEVDKAAADKVAKYALKLAKKSRWRHILDTTEKVGLFAAGAAVVYAVKK